MDLKKLKSLATTKSQPTAQTAQTARKKHYATDSLLAVGCIFLLTGITYLLQIYLKIPDSFLVYLLVVLALAALRGLYASLLASLLAFFLFDFLFLPPVYSLTVTKFSDILTLIVFLVVAILTSQLTSALRQRAEDASQRERETRMLYEILRAINREEDVIHQLTILARAIIKVHASSGIIDCTFLSPQAEGDFTLLASAPTPIEQIHISPDEHALIEWVRCHASSANLAIPTSRLPDNNAGKKKNKGRQYIRLIPLKIGQQVTAILRLSIMEDTQYVQLEQDPGKEHEECTSENIFFSAFLEQAVTIIEQGRLRNEGMQAKILQKTDTLRSALLSSVSHDLRTPLATIKTSVTSLQQQEIEWNADAQQSFISAIARETDRLNGLVENLLDMSRIEAGALHPEKVWYPLDELVHDVLERMHEQLHGRSVQVNIPDNIPPIELDSVQIDQVITNIIENAIHHTPEGSPIAVSISCTKEWMRLSVADRGPGVIPSEREQIFDKFYRVLSERPVTTYSRGSGLGLAICRALVEAHGGQIWVEAREGGGAIFHFTLPLSQIEGNYE